MKAFEGRTAVVTGAASGIGFALAERFAQARMNVVLADIEKNALDRAVKSLEERQHRVVGVVVNTMLKESVHDLARRAIDAFGKVHVLCNNAGVAAGSEAGKAVWELPDTDWEWVMGVNFYGVLYGLQAFVPHMLAHGEPGHVVNTASLAGLLPGGGPYSVSKHGVVALSEGLHRDLKLRNAAIRASVLCPGLVNTQIYDAERNRPGRTGASGADSPGAQQMKAMLSGGKQPAEVAQIVFDAIEAERFYVLPHPAWDGYLRSTFDAVLARGAPFSIDFEDMARRRAAGEVF